MTKKSYLLKNTLKLLLGVGLLLGPFKASQVYAASSSCKLAFLNLERDLMQNELVSYSIPKDILRAPDFFEFLSRNLDGETIKEVYTTKGVRKLPNPMFPKTQADSYMLPLIEYVLSETQRATGKKYFLRMATVNYQSKGDWQGMASSLHQDNFGEGFLFTVSFKKATRYVLKKDWEEKSKLDHVLRFLDIVTVDMTKSLHSSEYVYGSLPNVRVPKSKIKDMPLEKLNVWSASGELVHGAPKGDINGETIERAFVGILLSPVK